MKCEEIVSGICFQDQTLMEIHNRKARYTIGNHWSYSKTGTSEFVEGRGAVGNIYTEDVPAYTYSCLRLVGEWYLRGEF